jgi:hypothetical protein
MKTTIRRAAPVDLDALSALARRPLQPVWAFLSSDIVAGFVDSGASDQYVRNNLKNCSVIAIDGDNGIFRRAGRSFGRGRGCIEFGKIDFHESCAAGSRPAECAPQ